MYIHVLLYSNFGVRHTVQLLLSLSANSRNNNDIETYFFLTPLPYFSDLYLHSISLYMYILCSPPNFLFILPLYIKYAHHQINEHSFSIAFNTISFDIDYTFFWVWMHLNRPNSTKYNIWKMKLYSVHYSLHNTYVLDLLII